MQNRLHQLHLENWFPPSEAPVLPLGLHYHLQYRFVCIDSRTTVRCRVVPRSDWQMMTKKSRQQRPRRRQGRRIYFTNPGELVGPLLLLLLVEVKMSANESEIQEAFVGCKINWKDATLSSWLRLLSLVSNCYHRSLSGFFQLACPGSRIRQAIVGCFPLF